MLVDHGAINWNVETHSLDHRRPDRCRATQNKILIYDQFAPYVREVQRWVQKLPGLQPAIIEAAVKSAFSVEYAATIIDANAQKKWQLTPEQVEELKTEAALYAKALGMQSLTERIEKYIRDTAKRV